MLHHHSPNRAIPVSPLPVPLLLIFSFSRRRRVPLLLPFPLSLSLYRSRSPYLLRFQRVFSFPSSLILLLFIPSYSAYVSSIFVELCFLARSFQPPTRFFLSFFFPFSCGPTTPCNRTWCRHVGVGQSINQLIRVINSIPEDDRLSVRSPGSPCLPSSGG